MERIRHDDVFAIFDNLTTEPLHRRHRNDAGAILHVAAEADSTRRCREPLERRVDDVEMFDDLILGGVARTLAGTKAAA